MIFTIKKGRHYSNGLLYKIFSFINYNSKMSYNVKFNKTDIYVDNTPDKFDVNKLFGFSLGLHHRNSHRFGWNCLDGKVYLYSYSYVNGKRIINEICSVNLDEEYKCIIKVKDKKCIFSVISPRYEIKQKIIDIPNRLILGYVLWPYFGGNKTAPQNISIELSKNE